MAKATIGFHGRRSKFFLAPDFTNFALTDSTTVQEVIGIVLQAKKKSVLPAEKDVLVGKVCRAIKSDKAAQLKELDDEAWKKLALPLLCKVYLKQFATQACSLTRQQLLECDFNSGLPFDWVSLKEKVTQILALGFSRDDALEAIMVTGNKQVELVRTAHPHAAHEPRDVHDCDSPPLSN